VPDGLLDSSLRSEYMQPRGDSAVSVLFRLLSNRLQVVAMASLAKVSCGFAVRMDGRIASEYFISLIRSGEDRTSCLNCRAPKREVNQIQRTANTEKERRSLLPAKYSFLDILFCPSAVVMPVVMNVADFDDFMQCF
jgi:hypothetical protein